MVFLYNKDYLLKEYEEKNRFIEISYFYLYKRILCFRYLFGDKIIVDKLVLDL